MDKLRKELPKERTPDNTERNRTCDNLATIKEGASANRSKSRDQDPSFLLNSNPDIYHNRGSSQRESNDVKNTSQRTTEEEIMMRFYLCQAALDEQNH